MTNSNNWIRVRVLKPSPENAAGAECLGASALAQLLREATSRLFSRVALEVNSVSQDDHDEWLILLADSENGGEVLVLPPEPVVLADGISVQFGSISEAQEKSQFEKDFVIVSKEEIQEITSDIDLSGTAAEAPHANGHLTVTNDAIDSVGKQLQNFTLQPGANGDIHENDLVSMSAVEMQLRAAGTTVANALCQNSNHGKLYLVIVSESENVEADSVVGVNGSFAKSPLAEVSAVDIGKQFDGLTLASAENDNQENGHVPQSDTQTQLTSTQTAIAIDAPFRQIFNDGAGVDVNHSKQLGEIIQATVKPNSTNRLDKAVHNTSSSSGSSDECSDEENNVEQTTTKFWQYFVGSADSDYLREKLCAISNTLFPDTQQLNKEQIQQLLSIESRYLPPPLVRVAEVLLSKARRYQPWNEIVEKLDDFAVQNILGFAVDCKGLVLLLQYYLQPVKARQLYQRLAEQNSTLPFAANLPINHGSDHQSFHLLASHFRNLFVANIPILLSIGLPGCTGKSTFLNKCFECTFPQSSENAFHSASVDVSLSTESKPQNFHIFDCHGELPLPVVQLLASISSIVLVHVTLSDLKDNSEQSPLHQLLTAVDCDSKILLLVRDCTESALSKIRLPSFPEPIQSRLLDIVPVLKIDLNSRKFVKEFPKFLDATLKPLLDDVTAKDWPQYLPPDRYFSLYEQVEKRLSGLLKKSPNKQITLLARSEVAAFKAHELKQLLPQLPKGEDKARGTLFLRSNKFAKLCETEANIGKLSQQLGEDMKLREEVEQLKSAIRCHKKLDQLLSEILEIARSKDLEMYEEFLAVITHFKFISGAASSEPVSNLPPEFFWRELLLYAEYSDPEQRSVLQSILQEFLRILLASGYPIEIINGDTLTFIDPDVLAGILTGKEQKKLLVVSVVGPQSSGKSTLMNHLFGSGFAVSAGRCTKGMYLSTFDTSFNERIAVLDSEGLLSMATKGTAFDKQMAVMLLALSHVVLINVKGEMGVDMDHILEVALLGMQKLEVIHFKPKLMIVLRDLTDLRISKQAESIGRINEGMKQICERIQYDFTKVDESCYALVPSAFSEKSRPFHSTAIHDPNSEFLRKTDALLQRIRSGNAAAEGATTFTSSVEDWVSHSKATWGTLRQCGHLLHYKTLQEYFDREQLSKLTTDFSNSADEAFRCESMSRADAVLAEAGAKSTAPHLLAERFFGQVEGIAAEHLVKTIEAFGRAVENRNFSADLVEEYKRCLEQRSRMAFSSVRCEFDIKLARFLVDDCVQANIDKVKQHIDNCIRGQDSQPLNKGDCEVEFDRFWQSQAERMRQELIALKKPSPRIYEILRSAIVDALFKHTRFSKYPLLLMHDQRCVEAVEELLTAQPDSQLIKKYYIRTGFGAYVPNCLVPKHTLHSIFLSNVREVHTNVLHIVEQTSSAIGTQAIQRGLQLVEESLRTVDRVLQQHGAKFDLSFYTVWFSFLLQKYHEKFLALEDSSIACNLSIFESHKSKLLSAFTSLMRSRYSDIDTARELAPLILASLVRHSSSLTNTAFVLRIRNVARLEPAELAEICERRMSPADLKDYVLRCSEFMGDVFQDRFEVTLQQLTPEFEGMLKSSVGKIVRDLHAAINNWQSCLKPEEIQKVIAADSSERAQQLIYESLFQSFRAFLCGLIQPLGVEQFSDFSAASGNSGFAFIFDLIPDTFAICEPLSFCLSLKKDLDMAYGSSEVKLILDDLAFDSVKKEMQAYAVGCLQTCPMCRAKCSCSSDGHAKHQTKHHRLTAFAGCGCRESETFVFDVCTSNGVHRASWRRDDSDSFRPFDQFMATHHADWIIPLIPNAQIETKNILRWLQVKDKIIAHYRIFSDNTPAAWRKMAKRYCPVCIRLWKECSDGRKEELRCCCNPIGVHCLATLRGKHKTEQVCPWCSAPLG